MAASFSAWRTRFVERRVRADRTLPPLILVPGLRGCEETHFRHRTNDEGDLTDLIEAGAWK